MVSRPVTLLFSLLVVTSAARIKFDFDFPQKHRLNLDEALADLLSILRKPHLPERYIPIEEFQKWGLDHSTRMLGFSWSSCGNASDLFQIQNLTLGPDPLYFPGELDVSFTASILKTVNAPLLTVVEMDKKVGSQWIQIPCIGSVGSCTYDDLCAILATITTCPKPFIENKIPCKCPFNAGTYTLPESKFEISAIPLPAGDYRVNATLSMNAQPVGCYTFFVTIGN